MDKVFTPVTVNPDYIDVEALKARVSARVHEIINGHLKTEGWYMIAPEDKEDFWVVRTLELIADKSSNLVCSWDSIYEEEFDRYVSLYKFVAITVADVETQFNLIGHTGELMRKRDRLGLNR